MTNTEIPDPRPLYARALGWVHGLMAGVAPAHLDDPTPCSEFDVRALLGHLLATVDRARIAGEGGSVLAAPSVITDVADEDWATAHGTATEKLWSIWGDDALLDRMMVLPWGTVPGRAAVWGYLNETLVHGWDLAVAVGSDPEADADLAAAALAAVTRFLPAEPRGGPVPFAAVVESAAGAGPTERLANWSGHARL
ncbi:TIGR03086 family metal-binding protein [Pseudonocardia sp. GCM10023141]|uniref:TIGR03086 family metal-binding protein n=1 Tax=Pseudonocardia sp. GCM10023141 TaxID=3252653 RepID=UPI00361B2E50